VTEESRCCGDCAFLERGKCLMNAVGRAGCRLWASLSVLGDEGPLRQLWQRVGRTAGPSAH
jgi:hypothetical protein